MCKCVTATHEQAGCGQRVLLWIRAALFADLYDTPAHAAPLPLRVLLLNPGYGGNDPAGRRFSLLEID